MAKKLLKNIYVLDTCVLLHDPNCIYNFQEHDLYIPLACIDDLDEIKTRKDGTGWAAREVFRNLDKYDIQNITQGVIVNESGGKLFIYNHESKLSSKPSISRANSDNAIIETATALQKSNPQQKVVIVSKDTGLRVRAAVWDCEAENYKNDQIEGDQLYTGYRFVDVTSLEDWEYLNKREECVANKLDCKDQLLDVHQNEFICFRYGKQSVFAWLRGKQIEYLDDKKKKDTYMGISAKNMEQRFALEALADDSIPLVCLSGPAGSGKSLMALAVGLEKVDMGQYDRIIVMKPLIPVGGKEIGFLPGSKLEKISAWLGPIKDNLIQLTNLGSKKNVGGKKRKGANEELDEGFGEMCFEKMVEEGLIEVEALTYIQGRSIPNSYIILSEAENISPKEARMVVERCGKNSKVVLEGDLSQIENPYLDKNSCGLAHAINGGKEHEVAASVSMSKVERSILAAAASQIFHV